MCIRDSHKARQMAKERLNETFTVCQVLGVNRMVVHTGWMPFIYFKEWQAENSAVFWQDFMSDKPDVYKRQYQHWLYAKLLKKLWE